MAPQGPVGDHRGDGVLDVAVGVADGGREPLGLGEGLGLGLGPLPLVRVADIAGVRGVEDDEQGIDFAIMLPTLASLIEERMRDDPDLCAAAIHALNTWMLEAWPYAYKDRVFSTPIITPGVLDKAMEELDFLIEHDARVILMRPAPAWGYQGPRSFALEEFDP